MSLIMYGYIYKTTNLITNKIYIGQHKANYFEESYKGSGILINKSFSKYGIDNFKVELLEWCNSKKELDEREIYYISFYNSIDKKIGYNISVGGTGGDTFHCLTEEEQKEAIERWKATKEKNGTLHLVPKCVGHKLSQETKDKLSKIKTGKKLSEEHRRKISEGGKGRVVSEDTKHKISLGNKNKKLSQETKDKISKSRLGKSTHNRGKILIHNNLHNKYIYEEELETYLSMGYELGNINKNKSSGIRTRGSLGMRWYTNGSKSILCLPQDKPDDYYLKYKKENE